MNAKPASELERGEVVVLDGYTVRIEAIGKTDGAVVMEVQSAEPTGPSGRWTYRFTPSELIEVRA